MESPITTECDALREEVEMLAAENRRLLNEIIELRRVPAYPETAVRAVWKNGVWLGRGPFGGTEWKYNAEEISRIFTEALQKGG